MGYGPTIPIIPWFLAAVKLRVGQDVILSYFWPVWSSGWTAGRGGCSDGRGVWDKMASCPTFGRFGLRGWTADRAGCSDKKRGGISASRVRCRRWELNPHGHKAHCALNAARLPVPPLRPANDCPEQPLFYTNCGRCQGWLASASLTNTRRGTIHHLEMVLKRSEGYISGPICGSWMRSSMP